MSAAQGKQDDSAIRTGGSIPGSRKPAFSLALAEDLPIPVLLSVPHAGRSYPAHVMERMRRPEYSTIRLEDRYVDQLAMQIARRTGAGLLVAHAPRAVLDLNRATDDIDWEMIEGASQRPSRHSLANRRARSGLGLVPRRLAGLGEIWHGAIPRDELDARIEGIHKPYHAALGLALEQMRDRWGAALLIDLHSMPPLKPVHRDEKPAEFVIGDRFGSAASERLIAEALRFLGDAGVPVAHNRPYAGGYVLDRHARPVRAIHALQLEICRSRYLDPSLARVTSGLAGLAELVAGLVRRLGAETAALGGSSVLPIAAE